MKVKELLNNRWRWTKKEFARTWLGVKTHYDSTNASRYCLIGAVYKCYANDTEEFESVIQKIVDKTKTESLYEWNDDPNRTFKEVKQLVEELDI